ncbi:MAG: DDE-type integrase/transposase/recombinase [Sphingomonas sp.]|nr:DDE-type integrase/transposase/recombinase [Sphingomonas sp.]
MVEPVWANVRWRHSAAKNQSDARVSPLAMAPGRDVRDPKGGEANLNGAWVDLWRAVDQDGEILESYITKTRDKEAALRFMKKALKRNGSPETIVSDGPASYKAAMKMLCNTQKPEVGHGTTNRVQLTETSSL